MDFTASYSDEKDAISSFTTALDIQDREWQNVIKPLLYYVSLTFGAFCRISYLALLYEKKMIVLFLYTN